MTRTRRSIQGNQDQGGSGSGFTANSDNPDPATNGVGGSSVNSTGQGAGSVTGGVMDAPRIPTGNATLPAVEKLKGRENYVSWAFAMRMVMIREGTWRAVNPAAGERVNHDLSDRALATICLSIEPYNYSLVQRARTATEAWTSLKTAFQDCGKARKISLLRKLTRLELEDCSSVEEYVDEIMSTSHKLEEIGFKLDDEWLSLILLMGLPRRYEPMIMGLDASGIRLTADVVKSKILQDVTLERGTGSSGSSGALVTNHKQGQKKKPKDKSTIKCFKCELMGHYASECKSKAKPEKPEKGPNRKQAALLACHKSVTSAGEWILDSGAGRHMCKSEQAMVDCKKTSEAIYVANSMEIPVVAIGKVNIEADVEGECSSLDVSNVLCVPELAINLLSVSRICSKGYRVNFTKGACEVINESTGEVIATGTEADGLYKLNLFKKMEAYAASSNNLELWHRRLGHLNVASVKQLPEMVNGMEIQGTSMVPCVACVEGKHHKQPFKSTGKRCSDVLELVHSDLCGPMEKASIGGSQFFITFIDDASRMTFVYFLKSKGDAFEAFVEFKAYAEKQTGKTLKCLRSDNGGEYTRKQFQQNLKAHGIRHETTVPHNPQQNGLAERMNRNIQERARCLIFDAGLEKQFGLSLR